MIIQRVKLSLFAFGILVSLLAGNACEVASASPMISVSASGNQITISSDDPSVIIQINNKQAVLGSNTVPNGSAVVEVYYQNHIIYTKSFVIPFIQAAQPPSASTICPLLPSPTGGVSGLLNAYIKELIGANRLTTNYLKRLSELKAPTPPMLLNALRQDQKDITNFFTSPPCPASPADDPMLVVFMQAPEQIMKTLQLDLSGASSFINHHPAKKAKK